MAEEDPAVSIRRLRWPVIVATREQAAQVAGTGIDETESYLAKVWADIQPVGAMTFWDGTQTDAPFTHRLYFRWLDALDQTCSILRPTVRTDGVQRFETFRVRRIKDLGGRKRFVLVEAQLETLER